MLLFEKTSTRTRCSFEVAGMDLGMGVTYLDPGSSQMGKKESIEDTARVLGRMYDGIEYPRLCPGPIVEDLAANAGVPVWNGLTTEFHPTQMIADMLTVEENFPHGHQGSQVRVHGRRREQRGELAHGRVREAGSALCGLRPEGAYAEGRARRGRARK